VRTESGKQFVERIPVKLPDDVPSGRCLYLLRDGAALHRVRLLRLFVPQDLGDLVSTINKSRERSAL